MCRAYSSRAWPIQPAVRATANTPSAAPGPFPADWHARPGRVVLTGEYGGLAGFRHVRDAPGIEIAGQDEDLVFKLVQRCAAATGKPLTDDELWLIAAYPRGSSRCSTRDC